MADDDSDKGEGVGVVKAVAPRRSAASGRLLPLVAAVVVPLLAWGAATWIHQTQQHQHQQGQQGQEVVVMTAEELRSHDSSSGRELYLSILGSVFDVTAGDKFYGKKGGYRHFTGRDASRAFMTGDFTEGGLTDNMKRLVEWRAFFETTYVPLGKLQGRYYDAHGEPTAALHSVEEKARIADVAMAAQKREAAQYPNCNTRWSQAEGGEVWCDEGVPRRVSKTGQEGTRCACVALTDAQARSPQNLMQFQLYDGCAHDASRCRTVPPQSVSTAA
eukprot:jgi/Chlat1/3352/Chrsp23S03663